MTAEPGKPLSLQELPELRRKTDRVALHLKEQVTSHLETLRPVFAPERLFGRYAGGKIDVRGAERALQELQQKYKPYSTRPYDLPDTFDVNWLTLVGSGLEVQPWEYAHPLQGRPISITSPFKWVLSYRSSPSPMAIKGIGSGVETSRRDELRQTVVNGLVLQLLLQSQPGIVQLFRDLRFEITQETLSELPGFPVTTITACLSSFRPADDIVAAATAFSGIPSFVELLEVGSIAQPRDPLRDLLVEMTK